MFLIMFKFGCDGSFEVDNFHAFFQSRISPAIVKKSDRWRAEYQLNYLKGWIGECGLNYDLNLDFLGLPQIEHTTKLQASSTEVEVYLL